MILEVEVWCKKMVISVGMYVQTESLNSTLLAKQMFTLPITKATSCNLWLGFTGKSATNSIFLKHYTHHSKVSVTSEGFKQPVWAELQCYLLEMDTSIRCMAQSVHPEDRQTWKGSSQYVHLWVHHCTSVWWTMWLTRNPILISLSPWLTTHDSKGFFQLHSLGFLSFREKYEPIQILHTITINIVQVFWPINTDDAFVNS